MFWLLLASTFWIANLSLHLAFSNWLVLTIDTPFGNFVPRDYTRLLSFLILGLFVLYQIYRAVSGTNRLVTTLYWALWSLAALGSVTWLVTTDIEVIHFLQYGMLAWIIARAVDPQREHWYTGEVILLTLLLGIIDEANQYFFLTRDNSSYLDFNDFLLNQLGAVAGILTYYGFRLAPNTMVLPWQNLHRILASCCLLPGAGIAIGIVTGKLRYSPDMQVPPGGLLQSTDGWLIFLQRQPGLLGSWQESFSGGSYYVLGAPEGLALLGLALVLFAGFRSVSVRFGD